MHTMSGLLHTQPAEWSFLLLNLYNQELQPGFFFAEAQETSAKFFPKLLSPHSKISGSQSK